MTNFDLPTRRYSYDEIARWPDEARREVSDGTPVLICAPGFCPNLASSCATLKLFTKLEKANLQREIGRTFLFVDWQIDHWNSAAPDLCFFRSQRLGHQRDARALARADGQCLIAAPDLIVEVLDERTRDNDTQRKPALYAQQNVALFWLVAPQTQSVLVHQNPTIDGYQKIDRLTQNNILMHDLLPNFRLPLDQIFK